MARAHRSLVRRTAHLSLAVVAAASACIPSALAQPGDACGSATLLMPGTYSGSTVGATNDGAASCGLSSTTPDVWYRVLAATDCLLVVDTCGPLTAYDSVVSLHSACPGSAGNEAACNDDSCALSSVVRTGMLAGETMYIRVSGYNGATGPFSLRVACEEASTADACDRAIVVPVGTRTGTTVGATNDGSAGCGESATTADVWYRFTPSQACTLHVDTCGSPYDTVVSIHSGCPGTSQNQLVCNDDACALSTIVEAPVSPSSSYLIRVSGYNGATGVFNLNVQCVPSVQTDGCAAAATILPGEYSGDTSVGTPDGSSMCGPNTTPDVWYRFTAADDCVLRIDTCSATTFDSVLSIHTDCPGTTANEVACNDDSCGFGSATSVSAVAGTTYYIRVAPFGGVGGAFVLNVLCNSPTSDGPDAYVGNIGAMQQFGREGDVIGCVTDTPLCNAGTAPLPTMGNPNNVHPFFVWNMYRLSAGGERLEQIGWSWAKHMFGSAQGNECGFGCTPYPNGSHLGIGCSDTYSAGFNATQSNMGPRSEINPWTGQFEYAGSWIQRTGGSFEGAVDHRLQIRDADLNPAQNPGASYFVEQYTVAPMDANHLNSVARELVSVSGAPGGTWSFGTSAASLNGPAIFSWTGAQFTTVPPSDSLDGDGRCIIGYRVTPNGNGTWRYEYAVYNHDMNRGVQAVSVPIGGATITNTGFHAPHIHDEQGRDNDPWTVTLNAGRLTFATDRGDVPATSNPIGWGSMYNFRFDADRAPVESLATVTPYLLGAPSSFSGMAMAPAAACGADWDHSGSVTSEDFFAFLADFFVNNADFNNDGVTDSQDFFDFLIAFFEGCP